MAIEKRQLPTGEIVGWNTEGKHYCPLPKELENTPVSKPSLEEMSIEELKELADSKGIKYHWNAGEEKLIALLKEAGI